MDNILVTALLIGILSFAVFYLVRARKRGKKCIGCPYGAQCSQKNQSDSCQVE